MRPTRDEPSRRVMTWILVESTTRSRSRLGAVSWAARGADMVMAVINAKARGRHALIGVIRLEVKGWAQTHVKAETMGLTYVR
jgi:hypothetical protein